MCGLQLQVAYSCAALHCTAPQAARHSLDLLECHNLTGHLVLGLVDSPERPLPQPDECSVSSCKQTIASSIARGWPTAAPLTWTPSRSTPPTGR
eukprot:SAG22_NODE_993_length_6123_cov_15.091799_8_plen_94_part_00